MNDVIVRGRIMTDDARPIAQENVEVILPDTYGLSPSEVADPARFGNETHVERVVTDANGDFTCSFGPVAYHVDNFYIPFHIRIPARAPALGFLMRVPRVSSEYYAIEARTGSYKTFSEDGRGTPPARPLVSLAVHEEFSNEHAGWRDTYIGARVELRYASSEPSRKPSS